MSTTLPTLRQAGISNSGIRPRFAPVRNEVGTLRDPGEDFLAALSGNLGPLGAKVTEFTALGVSTVFACVHYIASTISTLPIDLFRTLPNGSKEVASGHPARRILRNRPNPIMVSSDVRYALAYNQALHHNAYAQLVFDQGGRIARIYPLKSRNVTMLMNGEFPSYRVVGDSGTKVFSFDRILHLRGMSADGLKGTGPLGLAANLIGLAQALEENAGRFFANGSRPGLAITTPVGVSLTESQKRSMTEQVDAAYRGVENAFKTIIVDGGGKVDFLRATNESSQFDEIAKRTHQQICQFFGVPPHKVQILDKATFSNIEQQQIQAVQDLFLPWCKRWEEAFGGALLSTQEQDIYFFKHNLAGLLRGDVVTRYQAFSTALQNGFMSINEVRALEDLDRIDGGDAHVRQLNMTDITAPAPTQNSNAA